MQVLYGLRHGASWGSAVQVHIYGAAFVFWQAYEKFRP